MENNLSELKMASEQLVNEIIKDVLKKCDYSDNTTDNTEFTCSTDTINVTNTTKMMEDTEEVVDAKMKYDSHKLDYDFCVQNKNLDKYFYMYGNNFNILFLLKERKLYARGVGCIVNSEDGEKKYLSSSNYIEVCMCVNDVTTPNPATNHGEKCLVWTDTREITYEITCLPNYYDIQTYGIYYGSQTVINKLLILSAIVGSTTLLAHCVSRIVKK